jgi:hypothetical protein
MDAWARWYPQKLFPTLWDKWDNLINEKRLLSSEEVLKEIERKEDALFKWAKERDQMFIPLNNDIQSATKTILIKYPKLVDSRTGKSFADPFVIATAQVIGATVITGESHEGSSKRPKIPNVCLDLNIPCKNIVQMIDAERWRF